MLKLNRGYTALIALAAAWGCSPDDYPTEARFDPPPIEIELPGGEVFIYRPQADGPEITSVAVAFVTDSDTTFEHLLEYADGRWVLGLTDLEPGIHEYKYVFNGETWATDMCNDPIWGDPANGGRVDSTVVACAEDGSGYAVRVIPVDELPEGELFFYVPPAGVTVTSVAVPGEFNGWNPSAPEAQMELLADGRWVLAIEGLNGDYQYKYHFNGDTWAGNMCGDATWGDPAHADTVDLDLDACDGENAVRTIGIVAPPGHTFLYIVPEGVDVEVVTAAGTFQAEGAQWNNTSDTLTNIWEYTVDLEPGTYNYKYVFNGGGWAGNMCDEANWGHPDYGNAVDPDNDNCKAGGEDAEIVIEEAGPHTFRYIVPAGVDSISQISVAGSFQEPQWTPDVDFMAETFQRHYELEPGTYEYKFIFDGNWAGNMCAEGTYADGGMVDANGEGCVEGGENALLTIE